MNKLIQITIWQFLDCVWVIDFCMGSLDQFNEQTSEDPNWAKTSVEVSADTANLIQVYLEKKEIAGIESTYIFGQATTYKVAGKVTKMAINNLIKSQKGLG